MGEGFLRILFIDDYVSKDKLCHIYMMKSCYRQFNYIFRDNCFPFVMICPVFTGKDW